MALMSFELSKSWQEQNTPNGREIVRVYTAQLSSAELNATPSAIRTLAEAAGLPKVFVSSYDGLLCQACDATRDERSQNIVTYRAKFTTVNLTQEQQQRFDDPSPINWYPITKVLVNNIEVPIDVDRNGAAITNAAGVRLLERIMIPSAELAFEITCNVASVPSWYTSLIEPDPTMNSAAVTVRIFPPRLGSSGVFYNAAKGTLRFIPGPIENASYNNIPFLRVTFRLQVSRPRKFKKIVSGGSTSGTYNDWNSMLAYLNCGFMYKQAGELKKIILNNYEEPRTEMLLKHDGTFDPDAQDPDDALNIVPDVHAESDYTVLPNVD